MRGRDRVVVVFHVEQELVVVVAAGCVIGYAGSIHGRRHMTTERPRMGLASGAAAATSGSVNTSSGDGKPRKLGRGLSSLLNTPVAVPQQRADVDVSDRKLVGGHSGVHASPVAQGPGAGAAVGGSGAGVTASAASSLGLVMLPIGQVGPGSMQPRRVFDEEPLKQLAESIRRSGVIQPVIVRPGKVGGAGLPSYELVAGERRWRAAGLAGLVEIPALVRALSDEETAEWALVENVQREDLNPMDRAEAFAQLTRRFGLSQAEVASRVGLDRTSVSNMVRLLELEQPIREQLSSRALSFGHGRALLAAAAGAGRVALAKRALDEGWSVRQLERAIATAQPAAVVSPRKAEDVARVAARAALEKQLGEHLGTKVHISTDRGGAKGRLTIEFFGLDHFDGLLHKFGFTPK